MRFGSRFGPLHPELAKEEGYPDLAGGEKQNTKLPTEIGTFLADALATSILESMPKFSMHRKNAADGNKIIGLWIACIYSRLAWVNH